MHTTWAARSANGAGAALNVTTVCFRRVGPSRRAPSVPDLPSSFLSSGPFPLDGGRSACCARGDGGEGGHGQGVPVVHLPAPCQASRPFRTHRRPSPARTAPPPATSGSCGGWPTRCAAAWTLPSTSMSCSDWSSSSTSRTLSRRPTHGWRPKSAKGLIRSHRTNIAQKASSGCRRRRAGRTSRSRPASLPLGC